MFRFVRSILVRPVFFSLLSCSLFSPWSWSRDLITQRPFVAQQVATPAARQVVAQPQPAAPSQTAAQKSVDFVCDLTMLSAQTYKDVKTLKQDKELKLFYARVENGQTEVGKIGRPRLKNEQDEVNFCGFVTLLKRDQTNSVIVAFHGTRTKVRKFFLHDVFIDFDTLGHCS